MDISNLYNLHYKSITGGRWGLLKETVTIQTGITGYEAYLPGPLMEARLLEFGQLEIHAGSVWDFGSGPTVNTPIMVRASLVHDAFCHFTNYRLVPWSVRSKGDKLFRDIIKEMGEERDWHSVTKYSHLWRWTGVATYSQLIARWKDKKNIE